ncbi:hypothetical protein GSF67_16730 [Agrobacterium sp. CGMCC 11546]|nr:hypothetical protein GSF67_16730 [Agrobacterium sp. CGMCC 11546]
MPESHDSAKCAGVRNRFFSRVVEENDMKRHFAIAAFAAMLATGALAQTGRMAGSGDIN